MNKVPRPSIPSIPSGSKTMQQIADEYGWNIKTLHSKLIKLEIELPPGLISPKWHKDTSEFVCHNFEYFWQKQLQWKYDGKEWMLFLCDSGGSNNCRHYIFKEDLYKLAQRLQVNIVVAHYPTYCSKYNPIERRLFCHVHRAWQGTVFKNIQIVKQLSEKTSTETGLSVDVTVNNRDYKAERQYAQEFKTNIGNYIVFDEKLPKWNYTILYKPL